MADLFRKSSLEKLSSPEQLDRMIVITSPSFWLAMLGVLVMVVVALLWSIFGRLPVKVESSGIYMNSDGVFPVYAQADGVVTEVTVTEGQTVAEGQVLMRLSNSAQAHEISELQQRIAKVKAITLASQNDEATADNRDLIDIKTQYTTLIADLNAAKTALAQKQSTLATQKAETARRLAAMESAKTAYYNALGGSEGTAIQLEYQEASTAHSQALSVFEQTRLTYEPLAEKQKQLEGEYLATIERYNETAPPELIDVKLEPPDNLGIDSLSELYSTLTGLWGSIVNAQSEAASAKVPYDIAKKALDEAAARLEAARAAYAQLGEQQKANSAEAQRLSSEFQLAQSNYQNALSLQTSTEAEIASLQQQIDAETQRVNGQSSVLDTQFASARQAALSQLESELAKYELNEDQLEVVATRDGVVTSLQAKQGAVVGAGSELAKVKQENASENVVVCYVSLADGKAITPGMQVMVSPTTINEQEYGFIRATVLKVDSFTTSSADILAQLGDNVLAEAFIKDGPVVAVTCQLEADPGTASGYQWSSSKGRDIVIPEGTLVKARIVTEEKAPISMVIPLIKETFTVREKAV